MKATSAVSLSFLDLLTCCLGAMLLLFFVIVLLRQQGGGKEDGLAVIGTPGEGEKEFLVVTVEAIAPGSDAQPALNWKLARRGNSIEMPKRVYRTATPRFAIFYVTEPLPRGTELWIEGGESNAAHRVSVFTGTPNESAEPYEIHGMTAGPVHTW